MLLFISLSLALFDGLSKRPTSKKIVTNTCHFDSSLGLSSRKHLLISTPIGATGTLKPVLLLTAQPLFWGFISCFTLLGSGHFFLRLCSGHILRGDIRGLIGRLWILPNSHCHSHLLHTVYHHGPRSNGLIGVVVTNAETMLSKAQRHLLPSTKEPLLIWPRCGPTGEEPRRWYKEGGCAERLRIALEIYTAQAFLIKTCTVWFNCKSAVAKQIHITVGRPAGCSRAITQAAIISTRVQVWTQVLTKSLYNPEVSQGHFFLFPRTSNSPPRWTSSFTCCHLPQGAWQNRPIWPLRVPALGGV